MKKFLKQMLNNPLFRFIRDIDRELDKSPLDTILNWRGETRYLSREVYVYKPDLSKRSPSSIEHEEYIGRTVRKISGINESQEPGYHTTEGWTTVCPTYAKTALFLGVLDSDLVLVED